MTTRSSTLSCAIVALAVSGAADGSPITYDFTVDATSGVLSGNAASGSFTFDSGTIPSGGGIVGATDLLTALNFRWDGITYNARIANTGWLTFNSQGHVTFFSFGNDCAALACTVNTPSTDWLASPGAMGFVYSGGGPFGFGKVSYSLLTSVSEPATGTLFALALVLGALALHIGPHFNRALSFRRLWKLYRAVSVQHHSHTRRELILLQEAFYGDARGVPPIGGRR